MTHQHAYLAAGVCAGLAGLLFFLIIHHVWIMPIWFILPIGLVVAALGGLAAGWACFELRRHLLPGRWASLGLAGLIAAVLLPALVLAELRPPLFQDATGAPALTVSVGRATALFVLELPLTAVLAGGLAGWALARTPRAACASALAGLAFALGPGHNIPFLGGTPFALRGLALLAGIVVVSAVVLVEAQLALAHASGARHASGPETAPSAPG